MVKLKKVPKRGLMAGRFQPFHLGHLHAVKTVLNEVDELIIVIGSAQYSHNLKNPFTAGERLTMIREALRDAKINDSCVWIVPVPDIHLHMLWVSSVEGYAPKFDIVYSNEPLTRRLFSEAGYTVKPMQFYQRTFCSSSEVRRRIIANEDWEKLVPEIVAHYIREIRGPERLQDLIKSDRSEALNES